LEITSFQLKSDPDEPQGQASGVLDSYMEVWKKKIIVLALMNWCRWSEEEAKKFVSKTILEFLTNARDHSGGSWVLSGFNVDERHLMIAVGDNGRGIPDSLRAAFQRSPELRDRLHKLRSDADLIRYFTAPDMILDSDLIRASTRDGLSSHHQRGGRGLYYCKEMVLAHDGELRIRSGEACVDFVSDQQEKTRDQLFKSTGTTVRVMLPRRK
jgi:signal transduction histidine kinase